MGGWVCNIPLYIFLFGVYLPVLCMCAQTRAWSFYLLTTFGLFTENAVCKVLRGLAVVWPETFLFLSIACVYTFFCIFLYSALGPRFG